MPSRDELISRKTDVQARVRQARTALERAQDAAAAANGLRRRRLAARAASLQAQLDTLMAEEANLRLQIDKSPRT
jgi:hypothetical protein